MAKFSNLLIFLVISSVRSKHFNVKISDSVANLNCTEVIQNLKVILFILLIFQNAFNFSVNQIYSKVSLNFVKHLQN